MLYLQPQTVKNYVHMILEKLDTRSRLEVIRLLRSGKFQPALFGSDVKTGGVTPS